MFKRFVVFSFAAFAAVVSAQTAPPKGAQEVVRDLANDHFVAGSAVRVTQPVSGDLIAAGGNVDVVAPIGGDALLAGGKLRVDADIGHSLYAGGGQLQINKTIGHNLRVAGGQVEITPAARVTGNVTVVGGQVEINGEVKGYVQTAGGRVFVNAPVHGDVIATAGNLELGPNARIDGKLQYRGREEIRQDPAAQVQGGVERMETEGSWPVPATMEHRMGRGGSWLWTVGLMVLAAILVAIAPDFFARVAETVSMRPAMDLLIGFIALVCIPVAALIFFITIIGVPLGLLTLALYPVLLLLGYVSAGIALGMWAIKRLRPEHANELRWRIGAAVLAVLVIALVARIPWLGGLIVFAVLLLGIGALMLQIQRIRTAA